MLKKCMFLVNETKKSRICQYGAFSRNDLCDVAFGQSLVDISSKAFCGYTFHDASG